MTDGRDGSVIGGILSPDGSWSTLPSSAQCSIRSLPPMAAGYESGPACHDSRAPCAGDSLGIPPQHARGAAALFEGGGEHRYAGGTGRRPERWRPPAGRRPTILVVDDDENIRDLLRTILLERYDVVTADSGKAGLAAAASAAVDLVLLDLVMPGLDGLEVLRELSRVPSAPKVIVLTALSHALPAVTALQYGAVDYLIKPVEIDVLLSVVGRALHPVADHIVVVGDRLAPRAVIAASAALLGHIPVVTAHRPPGKRGVSIDVASETWLDRLAAVLRALAPHRALTAVTLDTMRAVAAEFPSVSIARLARTIGISPGHLSRVLRLELGVPPQKFVMKVRLEAAKYLLLENRASLETIAELSGFCDPAHLSRVFGRETGMPPGRYRRSSTQVA